jgi:hypothetical protein
MKRWTAPLSEVRLNLRMLLDSVIGEDSEIIVTKFRNPTFKIVKLTEPDFIDIQSVEPFRGLVSSKPDKPVVVPAVVNVDSPPEVDIVEDEINV